MSIKTGRSDGVAEVIIDYSECISCALCVQVCKGAPLQLINGKVSIDQSRFFGCIACGHCATVCPKSCITVIGRDLFENDIIPIPPLKDRATYEQLYSLLLARRSTRCFQERPVEREITEKIIAAVSTAPMGLPPSDVEILVLDGREKVQEFAGDVVELIKGNKWLFSPVMRFLLRPFIGQEGVESFESFVYPACNIFVEQRSKGEDMLLYDAPLAMYFHTSPYADPADPLIAATYAMLAAESLGLGSCMIGTPAYFIKYSKMFKRKYGIPLKNQQGILLIFGYPQVKHNKSIKRRLGKITYF